MITDSDFKEIIQREGSANPPMEMIDRILKLADTITLRPGGILIPFGKIDTDLYIVRDGILQLLYLVKDKEQIFGFAPPGTFLCSLHSTYMRRPTVMQIESCKTSSTVLRLTAQQVEDLKRESPFFTHWLLDLALYRLYTLEPKLTLINGTAEDRYMNLLRHRPDIVNSISSKRLAQYLNVTPSWLCKIRKKLLYE